MHHYKKESPMQNLNCRFFIFSSIVLAFTCQKIVSMEEQPTKKRKPESEASTDPIVKRVCYGNFKVNALNSNGTTALHKAAAKGEINRVKDLIEKYKFDVNLPNAGGKSPLHIAALSDQIEIIKLLMHYGANVNSQDKKGNTPLMTALYSNNSIIANFLIENGGGVTSAYEKHKLPLPENINLAHNTSVSTHKSYHGIAINGLNRSGTTALHKAAAKGEIGRVLRLIIDHSFNVNLPDKQGRAPLHLAALNGKHQLVELLIRCHNADVNLKDNKGNTPLSNAVLHNNKKTAQILMSHGADPDTITWHSYKNDKLI